MQTKNDNREVVMLGLEKLKPYANQPFNKLSTEKLNELIASIKDVGIINPIIVRPLKDAGFYEILSGANRSNACYKLGITNIPAVIADCDDDTAAIIVTDSNLRHRENISRLEKGKAYKMQLEAIKRQGVRNDLKKADETTCPQSAVKLKAEDIVAQRNGTNKDEVRRYIRLTYLTPKLVAAIEEKKIPFIAGVELSYLKKDEQKMVYSFFLEDNDFKLDVRKSKAIRKESEQQCLTIDK